MAKMKLNSGLPWVGAIVDNSDGSEEWFGQLTTTLEDFMALPEEAFVRLNHVVWVEVMEGEDQVEIIANSDNDDIPFEHFIYVRKRQVSMIRPLRFPLNPPAVTE